jgi:hypothetical protein
MIHFHSNRTNYDTNRSDTYCSKSPGQKRSPII